MNLNEFKKLPIIGILRGITIEMAAPLSELFRSTGLKAIEVTMNTPGAEKIINQFRKLSNNEFMIGAGTILDLDSLKNAISAGASYIVTPCFNEQVVLYCRENHIPIFPGALTPSEIYHAWKNGADMVKVFPSSVFGPNYFKELKGPFNEIELLACGGVNPANICEYFTMGASGAAFGGSIFKKEWMENKEYWKIDNEVKQLVRNYEDWLHKN